MANQRGNAPRFYSSSSSAHGYGRGYGSSPLEAPAYGYEKSPTEGTGHGYGHVYGNSPTGTAPAPGYGYNNVPIVSEGYGYGHGYRYGGNAPTQASGYGDAPTETASYGYGHRHGKACTETAGQGYGYGNASTGGDHVVKPVKLSFHEMLSYGHKPWDADYREEKKALEDAFTQAAYADAKREARGRNRGFSSVNE